MEGISYEAASLAGTLGLNKLIVLYDSNDTSLDSKTETTFSENIEKRFKACNWNYIRVDNGENSDEISNAIENAKKENNKPTLIEVKTTIGKYSLNEGTSLAHGEVLTKENITHIKEKLKLRDIPFSVSNDTIEDFQHQITSRCQNLCEKFNEQVDLLNQDIKEELQFLINEDKEINFKDLIYDKPQNGNIESPRDTSGKMLTALVKSRPAMIGGSADLFLSTKTYIDEVGDFSSSNPLGKNIFFGVREHAMGAILNGLALVGYRPYGSTFLAFSNYLFPAIRLAAMEKLPITYIFTHDSISLGEDGATHQPTEQLLQLRSIPNLEVFRPSDANEVIGVYKTIMKKKNSPSVISLSKTNLPILQTTNSNEVEKGGYIVKNNLRKLDGIIISTGEEVHLALEVANRLSIKGIDIRVVSMPCVQRFLQQNKEYIEHILPIGVRKIVIEASSSYSWHQLIFNKKFLITLDSFGTSGKREDIYKKYGFDIESLEEKIENLLK